MRRPSRQEVAWRVPPQGLGFCLTPTAGFLLDTIARPLYNLMVSEPMGYAITFSERLDASFAALADPARQAMLARLSLGDASVLELAEPFTISQPAISKHRKVLERAGLISRSRDARCRPCCIQGKPLAEADRWLEGYRHIWERNFQCLDALLVELQSKGTKPRRTTSRGER